MRGNQTSADMPGRSRRWGSLTATLIRKTSFERSSGVCTLLGVNSAIRETKMTVPWEGLVGKTVDDHLEFLSDVNANAVLRDVRPYPQVLVIEQGEHGSGGTDQITRLQLHRLDHAAPAGS